MLENTVLPVRPASKAILQDSEGKILFAAGRRKGLNLPGGGIDDNETAEAALMRELSEEGVPLDAIEGGKLRLLPLAVEGVVTPERGDPYVAHWQLSVGRLAVAATSLRPSSEIARFETLSYEEAVKLRYPVMSDLAVAALRQVIVPVY